MTEIKNSKQYDLEEISFDIVILDFDTV